MTEASTERVDQAGIAGVASELAEMASASTASLVDYYDKWAASYDADLLAMGYEAPKVAAQALKEAGADPAGPILDAGCGTGLSGLELKKAGFSGIVGIDISPASLELARDKGCYFELKVQDLNGPLDFPEDRFAGAECVGTLTYIDNVAGFVGEICRVVQPAGIVLFTQRVDLYDDAFKATLREACEAGLWTHLSHSDPRPYIPGHKDYGTTKMIIYDVFRVG